MNSDPSQDVNDSADAALLQRSRDLFDASVEGVDLRMRSRLTQARHAALAARRPNAMLRAWAPSLAATAALVVGVALWMVRPSGDVALSAGDKRGLEDLEMVASNDQLDLLQNDPEFYDWIDSAAAKDGNNSSG